MTSENWRGGDRRRRSRRSDRQSNKRQSNFGNSAGHGGTERGNSRKGGREFEKNSKSAGARPKWKYTKPRIDPIPTPICPYCNEAIKDLVCAVSNREGAAAHFECVLKRVASAEAIERGDTVSYIGGGRFGVIVFDKSHSPRGFKIKKIIEWEQKDNPIPWRKRLADRFSIT